MAKIALQGNDAGTGTLTLQAPVTNINRNLVLPDVDGTLSTMEQVKLPIGSFMWFTGTVAPEAFVVADGELRSRAAFPDLWAFAQASGNISVDDASWTFGQYSPGDGSTTFRVPKVDDRFIRGKSATRAVGLVEEDAFQGHWHHVWTLPAGGTPSINGSVTTNVNIDGGKSSIFNSVAADVRSNGVNGTPRTANETRPKAITMLPCIKAYDVISDPNVLNTVGVVNEISRLESEKLRKDENINLGVSVAASGTAVDFVGIPEGVKRITVMFDGLSTNGGSYVVAQIGSGVIETSDYTSTRSGLSNNSPFINSTTAGIFVTGGGATPSDTGTLVFTKHDNIWIATGLDLAETVTMVMNVGRKSLSGPLDRLRITTVNGTDQFDAGTINIAWEF